MHHTHLMAVKHRLQDLLDAMTACKHQGGKGGGSHVSLSSAKIPCKGQGCWEGKLGGGGGGAQEGYGRDRKGSSVLASADPQVRPDPG